MVAMSVGGIIVEGVIPEVLEDLLEEVVQEIAVGNIVEVEAVVLVIAMTLHEAEVLHLKRRAKRDRRLKVLVQHQRKREIGT